MARGDEPFNASVAGTDAGTDLTVLRVESNSLKPAETGDLDSARVGELVLSVGRSVAGRHLGQLRKHRASWQPLANLARGQIDRLIRPDVRLYVSQAGSALVNEHRMGYAKAKRVTWV